MVESTETRSFVRTFVDELLRGGGGIADSRFIASAEHSRRINAGYSANTVQTLQYVQYCLREMDNVCRHSIGEGRYVVHMETECSDLCKEKYRYWNKWVGRSPKRCSTCNLELPTNGECGLCG